MSPEGIESPPCPRSLATAREIYTRLGQLRSWLMDQRAELNSITNTETITQPRELPPWGTYQTLAVMSHFAHYMTMRKVRDAWDALLRDFEDIWDHPQAVRSRLYLVQSVVLFMEDAFVDNETREARQQAQLEKLHHSFSKLENFFRKIVETSDDDRDSQDFNFDPSSN